jgi:hypothetical protein
MGPHFYESGRHMMQLVGNSNEADDIGKLLVKFFFPCDTFFFRFSDNYNLSTLNYYILLEENWPRLLFYC